MTGINNRIVMRQIRKNLLDRFLSEAESGDGRFDEFVRFVALEPVEINEDVFERISRLTEKTIGFGRIPSVRIGPIIPKPQFGGFGFGSVLKYIKQVLVSALSRVFRKMLIRLLIIEERPSSLMITKLNYDFAKSVDLK